jgi:hypothetical protein
MQDHASGARVLMQPASGSLRSLARPGGAAARAAPLRREAGTSLQAPRMLVVEAPSRAAAAASRLLPEVAGPCFRLLVESDRPHGRFVMHRTR